MVLRPNEDICRYLGGDKKGGKETVSLDTRYEDGY
jgi:hypothetical protein